jgi:hypothetical protein
MTNGQVAIAAAILAAASVLAFHEPASAAKIHLKNCTNNIVDARTYNSYDSSEAVAAKAKNVGAKDSDDNTATLSCTTDKCRVTLNGKDQGKHGTSHHLINAGPKLSDKVSESDYVCP